MNSKQIKKYRDIAHMNKEAFLCMNSLNLSTGDSIINHNLILLSVKPNSEISETEEWTGFVQNIKIFVKKHLNITNKNFENQISALSKKIESDVSQIKKILE